MWNTAARLWAEQKINGTPNSSDEGLDGDALLAAQAIELKGIVITENIRHISKMVTAKRWDEL